jgi:hypothetical protein
MDLLLLIAEVLGLIRCPFAHRERPELLSKINLRPIGEPHKPVRIPWVRRPK